MIYITSHTFTTILTGSNKALQRTQKSCAAEISVRNPQSNSLPLTEQVRQE